MKGKEYKSVLSSDIKSFHIYENTAPQMSPNWIPFEGKNIFQVLSTYKFNSYFQ